MAIEYEVKFKMDAEHFSTFCEEIPGPETHYDMETTWFDTPSGALTARHYTLRQRLENGKSVFTLKTPYKYYMARREYVSKQKTLEKALPVLCRQSKLEELPALLAEGLVPICGARFKRITKEFDLDGCIVELAMDEGVLIGGGREVPFSEIEFEKKKGNRELLYDFGLAFAVTQHIQPLYESKFVRAMKLARGEDLE